MRSRFLLELTTPEVESYLAAGGDLAILPIGSVEMHGPHQPIGTDTFVAKAFALRIAESANGLILPEVAYTWAGATDGFAGTISVEAELMQQLVRAVALKALRAGFRRVLLISGHSPNKSTLFYTVRHFFETEGAPLFFVDAFDPLDETAAALFAGPYAQGKEASIVLAALQVLGLGDLYREAEMRRAAAAPPGPGWLGQMLRVGTVGYFMQDPRQHACPSEYVSLERGLRFIAAQVETILPALAAWQTYRQEIGRQANRGWGRQADA